MLDIIKNVLSLRLKEFRVHNFCRSVRVPARKDIQHTWMIPDMLKPLRPSSNLCMCKFDLNVCKAKACKQSTHRFISLLFRFCQFLYKCCKVYQVYYIVKCTCFCLCLAYSFEYSVIPKKTRMSSYNTYLHLCALDVA